jgi:hypothetical protein
MSVIKEKFGQMAWRPYAAILAMPVLFVALMLLFHRYVFLYADDYYYAGYYSMDGLHSILYLIKSHLASNGRLWVHFLLTGLVEYGGLPFRLLNPVFLGLVCVLYTFIAQNGSRDNRKALLVGAVAVAFFLSMPYGLSMTSLYYAACALNYVYPTILAIAYGYALLRWNLHEDKRPRCAVWLLPLLAFLGGSSTQQVGMITIGFIVLTFLYLWIFVKEKPLKRLRRVFLINLLFALAGFLIVLYGAFKRAENEGSQIDLHAAVDGLIYINFLSPAVKGFVIVGIACCILWMFYFAKNILEKSNGVKFHYALIGFLVILVGFYFYLCRRVSLMVSPEYISSLEVSTNTFFLLVLIGGVFLVCVMYTGLIILKVKGNPFPLFCLICAVGSQLCMMAAEAKYTFAPKVMIPALLLCFVYILVTVWEFCGNRLFLATILAALAVPSQSVLVLVFVGVIWISAALDTMFVRDRRNGYHYTFAAICVIICFALLSFAPTWQRYQEASVALNYNLKAIKAYQLSPDKSVLQLRKGVVYAGYNMGIWNEMPFFMKDYFQISEDTKILYEGIPDEASD